MNARNLFKGINEFATSLLNYYIGILEIEPKDYEEIDKMIRKELIKHKAHFPPSNVQRLYLSRNKLGTGFKNVEFKGEVMLLQLNKNLAKTKYCSLRKDIIYKVEKENQSHLSLISTYLKTKYNINECSTVGELLEFQEKNHLTI